MADPDPGRKKITAKIGKNTRIIMLGTGGCSLLRTEGFSCSLGVLYGVLWISKYQFYQF
jgi:hypothetical protein